MNKNELIKFFRSNPELFPVGYLYLRSPVVIEINKRKYNEQSYKYYNPNYYKPISLIVFDE